MISTLQRHAIKVAGRLLHPGGTRGKLSVLTYHRVLPASDPMIPEETNVDRFRVHMDALAENFNVVSLSEGLAGINDGSLPPRSVCITFDDGYENNYSIAFPILKERSLSATFFIATKFLNGECMWNDIVIEALRNTTKSTLDLVHINLGRHQVTDFKRKHSALLVILKDLKKRNLSERALAIQAILEEADVPKASGQMMSKNQVRELARSGMEIGGHTSAHPILSTLTDDQAALEIERGKMCLEEITGRKLKFFAYPNGRPGQDFNERHVQIVRDLGFEAAVTTESGYMTRKTDPFLIPRLAPWDQSTIRFSARLLKNAAS